MCTGSIRVYAILAYDDKEYILAKYYIMTLVPKGTVGKDQLLEIAMQLFTPDSLSLDVRSILIHHSL